MCIRDRVLVTGRHEHRVERLIWKFPGHETLGVNRQRDDVRAVPNGDSAQPVSYTHLGQPRWSPATLEEVDPAEISRILDPNAAAGERVLKL